MASSCPAGGLGRRGLTAVGSPGEHAHSASSLARLTGDVTRCLPSNSETSRRLKCQNQSPLCYVKSSAAEQRTVGAKEPERGGAAGLGALLVVPGEGWGGQSPGTGHQAPVGPESAGVWLTSSPPHSGPVPEPGCSPVHTPRARLQALSTGETPECEPVTSLVFLPLVTVPEGLIGSACVRATRHNWDRQRVPPSRPVG